MSYRLVLAALMIFAYAGVAQAAEVPDLIALTKMKRACATVEKSDDCKFYVAVIARATLLWKVKRAEMWTTGRSGDKAQIAVLRKEADDLFDIAVDYHQRLVSEFPSIAK